MRNDTTPATPDDRTVAAERVIAALFPSRQDARDAIKLLHKAHYTHTWLGTTSLAVTSAGDETIALEDASPGLFFSKKSQSLVDALVDHGVAGEVARAIAPLITVGTAVLVLDPKDKDPREAETIIEDAGGEIASEGLESLGGQFGTGVGAGLEDEDDDVDDDVYVEVFYLTRE